VTCCTI